jgi:hypothetical protein
MARMVDIPLDGVASVSGSVQVRFTWHPQLLINKKTQTSVLGTTSTYAHDDVNLEASGPLPRKSTSSQFSGSIVRSSFESMDRQSLPSDPNASQSPTTQSHFSFEDNVYLVRSSITNIGAMSDATGRPGVVVISLLEARGLRGVDKRGTSDPFVSVKVGRKAIYKTKVIPKTLAPSW